MEGADPRTLPVVFKESGRLHTRSFLLGSKTRFPTIRPRHPTIRLGQTLRLRRVPQPQPHPPSTVPLVSEGYIAYLTAKLIQFTAMLDQAKAQTQHIVQEVQQEASRA